MSVIAVITPVDGSILKRLVAFFRENLNLALSVAGSSLSVASTFPMLVPGNDQIYMHLFIQYLTLHFTNAYTQHITIILQNCSSCGMYNVVQGRKSGKPAIGAKV